MQGFSWALLCGDAGRMCPLYEASTVERCSVAFRKHLIVEPERNAHRYDHANKSHQFAVEHKRGG